MEQLATQEIPEGFANPTKYDRYTHAMLRSEPRAIEIHNARVDMKKAERHGRRLMAARALSEQLPGGYLFHPSKTTAHLRRELKRVQYGVTIG